MAEKWMRRVNKIGRCWEAEKNFRKCEAALKNTIYAERKAGMTAAKVAAAAGVDRRTVDRWMAKLDGVQAPKPMPAMPEPPKKPKLTPDEQRLNRIYGRGSNAGHFIKTRRRRAPNGQWYVVIPDHQRYHHEDELVAVRFDEDGRHWYSVCEVVALIPEDKTAAGLSIVHHTFDE